MRLIDADKIDFGKVFIGSSDFAKDTREAAQKFIEEQPTAYNMESVIQQLKEESCIIDNVAGNRAVEIIEAGGAEPGKNYYRLHINAIAKEGEDFETKSK